MPTESEFRDQLRGDDGPTGSIDLDRVIRRARARRAPRVVAIAAGSVLAVAAIAVPVTVSAVGMGGVFPAAGSGGSVVADSGGSAPEKNVGTGGSGRAATAATLTRCGSPLPSPAPAANGLLLTVTSVAASTGTADIAVTVRMTNTGPARVQGATASQPIVSISEGGLVVWHVNGAMDASARIVDLAPGASMTYATTIRAVRCAAADEGGAGFPADLPPLEAGTYAMSAAIDLMGDGSKPAVLVTGPTSTLLLH